MAIGWPWSAVSSHSGNRATLGYGRRKISMKARKSLENLDALRAINDAAERELVADGIDPHARPRNRADCRDGPRPCPWASCRYHLAIEVNVATGSLTLNFPDRELWELPHTCALDGADEGGMSLEMVGKRLNLVRERARQIEVRAIAKIHDASADRLR